MIAAFRWLRDWFQDESVVTMLRQQQLATAEEIARAIRRSTPKGHATCTSWPHCTRCGRAAQAERDAEIALRAGAGK